MAKIGIAMLNKKPRILAVALTALLLILSSIFWLFMLALSLNGMQPEKSTTAMVIWLLAQSLSIILAAGFAGWIPQVLIAKWNWNKILAVFSAVLAGTILGTLLSFISIVLTAFLVGLK